MFELTLGLGAVAVFAQLAYRMCAPGAQLLAFEDASRARPPRTPVRAGLDARELARRGAITLVALGIVAVGLALREPSRATGSATPPVAALR